MIDQIQEVNRQVCKHILNIKSLVQSLIQLNNFLLGFREASYTRKT
jgi:hypothetical protein